MLRRVEAVGADPDERMITIARARRPHGDFRIADVRALPLPEHSTGGYRADKVFHELAEPERALAEARRVLAPGGRIVLLGSSAPRLLGQDWDTVSSSPALARTIVHARADLVTAPRAAPAHRNLLLDAGFRDVAVDVRTTVLTGPEALPMPTGLAEAAHAFGAVTRGHADGRIAEQRARADRDRLFLALPVFLASAVSPVTWTPASPAPSAESPPPDPRPLSGRAAHGPSRR